MASVATSAEPPPRKRRLWDVLKALTRPRVAIMLAMGISSGLPFMLIGNTLGAWLKLAGVGNAMIGFASWVGMAYTIKFLWGAMVDRIPVPLLGRLGRRRSWMLVAQLVAGGGLIGMGLCTIPRRSAQPADLRHSRRRRRRRGHPGHRHGRLADRDCHGR